MQPGLEVLKAGITLGLHQGFEVSLVELKLLKVTAALEALGKGC